MALTCSLICFHGDAHPSLKPFGWSYVQRRSAWEYANVSVNVVQFTCTWDRINKRIVHLRRYSLHMTWNTKAKIIPLPYQLIRHLEKTPLETTHRNQTKPNSGPFIGSYPLFLNKVSFGLLSYCTQSLRSHPHAHNIWFCLFGDEETLKVPLAWEGIWNTP